MSLAGPMSSACGHVGIDLNGDTTAEVETRDAAPKDPTVVPSDHPDATSQGGSTGAGGATGGEPRDAGMDGAVADSGVLDPPMRDAGEAPDAGNAMHDADRCEADCPCASGETCRYDCTTSPCEETCQSASVCEVRAGDAPIVNLDCGAEATCKVVGGSTETNDFTCSGAGDCSATCGTGGTCSMNCTGSGLCTLRCASSATCVLDCADTARCLLVHESQDAEAIVECKNRIVCESARVTACNTDCPQPTL